MSYQPSKLFVLAFSYRHLTDMDTSRGVSTVTVSKIFFLSKPASLLELRKIQKHKTQR